MKILHINISDKNGGAAIAAYRHNEAMQKAGFDSKMLVIKQVNKYNQTIYTPIKNKHTLFLIHHFYYYLNSILQFIYRPFAIFSFNFIGFKLHKNHLVKDADIIYIHWINGGMLSTKEIQRILKTNKTVYWYMHDMYPLTGGCHHSFDCTKYQHFCKKCPHITRFKWIDLVATQFKQKLNSWKKYPNLKVITPSNWLGNLAQSSQLFCNHEVTIFTNVINTDKFKPINKIVAKEIIGINTNKKIILFGADNINNPYKGWNYLKEALNNLDYNEYECLVFGAFNPTIKADIKIKTTFTGFLKDEYSLITVYNAADIFISTSLADNFPNVILEAMSCGLPCIGFNVGGIPDLIQHKETGYLAIYKNTNDLIKGINWVFKNNYSILSQNSRKFIVNNCSYNKYQNWKFNG